MPCELRPRRTWPTNNPSLYVAASAPTDAQPRPSMAEPGNACTTPHFTHEGAMACILTAASARPRTLRLRLRSSVQQQVRARPEGLYHQQVLRILQAARRGADPVSLQRLHPCQPATPRGNRHGRRFSRGHGGYRPVGGRKFSGHGGRRDHGLRNRSHRREDPGQRPPLNLSRIL